MSKDHLITSAVPKLKVGR